jgi:Domain of unknown function (DUF4397)
MTQPNLQALRLVLVGALTAFALTACGGGDDDGGASEVRVVNATADLDSLDVTLEDDDDDESTLVSALARDTQSGYDGVNDETYTVRVKRAGSATALAISSAAISSDERYTMYVYGREGDYRVYNALDDEDEPDSGKALLRVFHAAPDAGAVDVYLTDANATLDSALATLTNVGGGAMGFYVNVTPGTYRMRITATGDKEDLRLDLASIEIANRARTTVVLQPGPSGVLVHALVSQYQGALAINKNTQARARLVAGVTGNGAVTASLGSASLNVNLRSPSVGSYKLVSAGNVAATVSINASTTLGATVALTPGGDYTVAAFGDAAAPTWRLIADDNRPPTATDRARMRLLHMAYGVDNLTLSMDYEAVAGDVAFGNASSYSQTRLSSEARVEVTSPLSTSPLYLSDDAVISSRGVYTVFMLSGATAPTGILRRER